MANLNQVPHRPFTKDAILALTPGQNGVYGIHNGQYWIYIGRGDIRTRLLAHFNGDIPEIFRHIPLHYSALVVTNDIALEKAEIIRLQPRCNQRLG